MEAVQLNENDDPINICYDNVFKAVFTKDGPESRGALSGLLSAVIGAKVSVVKIAANEPAIDNTEDRGVRFDLHCKEEACGKLFNVEMSFNPDRFEPLRLEFYAAKLFTGQEIGGSEKTYDDLKEAYQIAILVNGCFFDDNDFLHNFEYYDQKRNISLGGRSRIITLELFKLKKAEETAAADMTAAERWGFFFKYITDKAKREKINDIIILEEGIAMANQVLMGISRNEAERARLLSEYKYKVDTQSKVVQARREGRQEGEQQGLCKTARNLKAMGITTNQITQATGLSPDEIARL